MLRGSQNHDKNINLLQILNEYSPRSSSPSSTTPSPAHRNRIFSICNNIIDDDQTLIYDIQMRLDAANDVIPIH